MILLAFLPSVLFGVTALGLALLAGLREQPRSTESTRATVVRNRSLVALAAVAAILCLVCLLAGIFAVAVHEVLGGVPRGTREPFD